MISSVWCTLLHNTPSMIYFLFSYPNTSFLRTGPLGQTGSRLTGSYSAHGHIFIPIEIKHDMEILDCPRVQKKLSSVWIDFAPQCVTLQLPRSQHHHRRCYWRCRRRKFTVSVACRRLQQQLLFWWLPRQPWLQTWLWPAWWWWRRLHASTWQVSVTAHSNAVVIFFKAAVAVAGDRGTPGIISDDSNLRYDDDDYSKTVSLWTDRITLF